MQPCYGKEPQILGSFLFLMDDKVAQDCLNLTGAWFGVYHYAYAAEASVRFIAALNDSDGQISGSISEPNSIGGSSDLLNAIVHGNRLGKAVEFVKAYDGASDAAHAVQYEGVLAEGGELIHGFWTLDGMSGAFEMTRRHISEAEAISNRETVAAPAG
jgi:hypothetical protein